MRGCESGLHVVAEGNVELMYGVGGRGLRACGSAEGCVLNLCSWVRVRGCRGEYWCVGVCVHVVVLVQWGMLNVRGGRGGVREVAKTSVGAWICACVL